MFGKKEGPVEARFPSQGHVLICGVAGSGKTRLVRKLISTGYFGDDARIDVVTEWPHEAEYAAANGMISSLSTGEEGLVAALAAARAVGHYRRMQGDADFPAPDARVVVVDSTPLVRALCDPSDVMVPASEMARWIAVFGRMFNIRLLLAVHSKPTSPGYPGGPVWFRENASVVTVDYPRRAHVDVPLKWAPLSG